MGRLCPALAERCSQRLRTVLTLAGALALALTVVAYGLERRHRAFVLLFACGCVLSSAYGFVAGVWPFGMVEAVWALVALNRAGLFASPSTSSISATIAGRSPSRRTQRATGGGSAKPNRTSARRIQGR